LSITAISRRYARALVDLGVEGKMVERYGAELATIRSAFHVESGLRLILESPTFPLDKKKAILSDLLEAIKASPGIRNFLGLLLEKQRLQHLEHIEEDYRRLADELAGILRARIVSATTLEAKQLNSITSSLEKRTGMKVEPKVQVDPSLIGGIQVEIGGKVFDGSVKTQLKRIEDILQKG